MTRSDLFREYASYHADGRNRVCHAVGIPLITLGIMGVAALVHIGRVDLAVVMGIAVLLYYAWLDLKGALLSAVIFALLYVAAVHMPWYISVAAFAIGWIFQLVGHKFEGSKPKFLENLIYLLIGPLYIFEEMTGLAR